MNAISCVETNVQPGSQRLLNLPNRTRLRHRRCELTALSKVYNLYFVAYNDMIHVYQPNFPDQSLNDEPFVLHPPVSSPGLNGDIDPMSPHSITRLHVDFLGREEIVLVACDDGDVIGYRVLEIQRAIEQQNLTKYDPKCPIPESPQIRVFLHRNVGRSAWGLAVHREARLVAISANTHKVTVIAYALAGSSESTGSQDFETQEFLYPRRQDNVIICTAQSNIPSVSFDNSGGDPSGKWLFSSSIDGKSLLWDLHRAQSNLSPVREINLGYCHRHEDLICECDNYYPHAVWATMFLDTQSFHQTYHLQTAFGDGLCKVDRRIWELDGSQRQRDIDQNTDNPSMLFEGEQLPVYDSDEMVLDSGSEDGDQTAYAPPGSSNEDTNNSTVQTSMGTNDGTTHFLIDTGSQSVDALPSTIPWVPQNLFLPVETQFPPAANQSTHDSPTSAPASSNEDEDDNDNDNDDDDDDDDDDDLGVGIEWEPAAELSETYVEKDYYCDTKTADSFPVPTHQPPCIIVTKNEIYMFQRPLDPSGDATDTIVTMTDPLYADPYRQLPNDRLCYTAQIPELGIFIVASPGGRAAIFSLTQFKGSRNEANVYGFRLDHMLPSQRQVSHHRLGWAYGNRLVGIAVGPIQGMLDGTPDTEVGDGPRAAGARRWRLLIMHEDHTVLSYELGRCYEEADEAPLADLLV